jgi:hypothetical protein
MIGGILYSYVKYHEGERKKRDKLSGDSSTSGNTDPSKNQVTRPLVILSRGGR